MNTKKIINPLALGVGIGAAIERRAKGSVSWMGNWDRHRIHFLHDPKK